LENTFENTVTVIVKVIIEEVQEFLIPAIEYLKDDNIAADSDSIVVFAS
jgi:hypothetical protein